MNKIKHHPLLANITLFCILMVMVYSVAFTVSLWLLFIAIPVLALYMYGFAWNEKFELICPECQRTYWDKTRYYCNHCGTTMVFRKKEKVKMNEAPKPEHIAVPTCSKGHEIYSYDQYCSKCGEKLKV